MSLPSPPHFPFPSQPGSSCHPQTSPRVIQCLSSCSGRQAHLAFVSVPSFPKETSDVARLGTKCPPVHNIVARLSLPQPHPVPPALSAPSVSLPVMIPTLASP